MSNEYTQNIVGCNSSPINCLKGQKAENNPKIKGPLLNTVDIPGKWV